MNLSGRVFEIYRIENKKNIGLLAAFPYVNGGLFADDDIEFLKGIAQEAVDKGI